MYSFRHLGSDSTYPAKCILLSTRIYNHFSALQLVTRVSWWGFSSPPCYFLDDSRDIWFIVLSMLVPGIGAGRFLDNSDRFPRMTVSSVTKKGFPDHVPLVIQG